MAVSHRLAFLRAKPLPGGTWVPPYALPTAGRALELPGTSDAEVDPSLYANAESPNWDAGDFRYATAYAWTGPVYNKYDGPGGRVTYANLGGHGAAEMVHAAGVDLTTGTRYLEKNAAGVKCLVPSGFTRTNPGYRKTVFTDTYVTPNRNSDIHEIEGPGGRIPVPGHSYQYDVAIPGGLRGLILKPTSRAILVDSWGIERSFAYDAATAAWEGFSLNLHNSISGASNDGYEGSCFFDEARGRGWLLGPSWHGGGRLAYLDTAARLWRGSDTYPYPSNGRSGNPLNGGYWPTLKWLVVFVGTRLFFLDTTDKAATNLGWRDAGTVTGVGRIAGGVSNYTEIYEDDQPGVFYFAGTRQAGDGEVRIFKLVQPANPVTGVWQVSDVTMSINTSDLTLPQANVGENKLPWRNSSTNNNSMGRAFHKLPNHGPSMYGLWPDSGKRYTFLNLAGV